MDLEKNIQEFFDSDAFAVVGASADRQKYGNKVLRVYLQNNKKVIPINPNDKVIEGVDALSDISQLPPDVASISIITPPAITEKIVDAAIQKGIRNIWMQPGAESEKAIAAAVAKGINVIANGPCILVVLGFHE